MNSRVEIPEVPEVVLRNKPQRWGGRLLPDDEPLPTPRLIAIRRDRTGRVQALYKTVENSHGGRGFIVDDTGEPSNEYAIATLTNSPYWLWELAGR